MHDPVVSNAAAGPGPAWSPDRLAAVRRTGLLDTAPEHPFDQLTELARELLDVPVAMVTVVDDRHSWWKSSPGVSAVAGGRPETTLEDSFCQYVLAAGEPVLVPDVLADARTADLTLTTGLGLGSYAGFPVRTPDGHVLGAFAVLDTRRRGWGPDDVRVLSTLAVAVATEVALRVTAREAERQRARAAVIARAGELLAAGLERADVLAAVGQLAVPALGDVAMVHHSRRDHRLLPLSARHVDPLRQQVLAAFAAATPLTLDDDSGPGAVAATGHSELVVDAQPDGTGFGAALAALGLCSHLSVPLSVRGEPPLGVLTVARAAGGEPYGADDLALVEAVATSVSPALDNARLFASQRDFSVQLQEALLTPPPDPDHLHVVVRYSPAEQQAQIGGDWYDAFLQPDGSTVLVIGDVAGHDSGAAVAMGQLRGLIRAIAYDTNGSPAEVLSRSDVAAAGLRVDAYATVLVARIERVPGDLTTRRVLWSNAGHPPPVLIGEDGGVTLLERRPSPMLGVDPATVRVDHELSLADGQTLVLYTDGLVERRHVAWEDSVDMLVEALSGAARLPLDALCDLLLRRMRPTAGEDDVALVAVRPYDQTRPPPAPGGPETAPLDLTGTSFADR